MMAKLELLNDQALGEGNPVDGDGLGFDVYSQVIADTATGTPGPFTIGVFGEWGTGKTSMLRMVKEKLDAQPGDDVVTVWFNAWRYEQEENPIVPLVGTIIHTLEKNKSFLAKLTDNGKDLIRALRAVAYGFSLKAKVGVPGLAEVGTALVAKDMIDREEALTPDPLLDRSLYYEVFESLDKVKLTGSRRVVVIIDDLDRCFPNQAVKLLESIKLVLSQQGFIFVLGVAREVIEGYLKHRYATDFGIADFDGKRYLDKIVQLPFPIPDHKNRMKDLSKILLKRLAPSDRKTLKNIVPIIANASGGNPRTVIRLINNILIDSNINERLVSVGMERIPLEYFAVTRILQQRWNVCYLILIRSKDIRDRYIKKTKSETGGDAISVDKSDLLTDTVMLHPELNDLLHTDSGQKWLSQDKKRGAAIEFLNEQRKEDEVKDSHASIGSIAVLLFDDVPEEIGLILDRLNSYQIRTYDVSTDICTQNRNRMIIEYMLSRHDIILLCVGAKSAAENVQHFFTELIYTNQNWKISKTIVPLLLPDGSMESIPSELHPFTIYLTKNMSRKELRLVANRLSRLLRFL